MDSFFRLFSLCSLALLLGGVALFADAKASTRAPASVSEHSLLYWRYLCREQPQRETTAGGFIELTCLNQNWKVRANARDGKISEVIENVQ